MDDLKENPEGEVKKEREIIEVRGNAENIERLGSPVDRAKEEGQSVRYYFYPTWRSQILRTIGYLVLSILTVVLCRHFSSFAVISGPLFTYGDNVIRLYMPWPALIPGFLLVKILLYIYNSKYIIDERGVEAQIGLVSLNLRQPRLRYEDIRGIEPQQTLWERILGIGSVLIGSAMTQDVEIVMSGVANPRAIQLLVSGERDKRLKKMGISSNNVTGAGVVEFIGD